MENNQNNNKDRKSTSTRGSVLKNSTVKIPCGLELTYQDEMVRLAFIPPLPESARGERRLYDYDNTIQTLLTRKKAQELYAAYEKIIVPAMKDKVQKFVSVTVGESQNHLGISTGVNLGTDGECHPCIILIRGIDPTTKKSNDVILYEFVRGELYVDYNPVTGESAERLVTDNELETFMEDLNVFRGAMSKAYTHSNRVVDRSYKDMLVDMVRAIMDKLGVQSPQTFNRSGGNSNYNAANLGYGNIFNMPAPDRAAQESVISDASQLADALG